MKQLTILNKSILLLLMSMSGKSLMAQNATAGNSSPSLTLDVNTLLVIVAGLLLCVIAALGYTLVASLDLYKKKKSEANSGGQQVIKTVLIFVICMSTLQVFGQDGALAAPTEGAFADAKIFRYLLFGIITLELIAIFAMVYWIRFFTGIQDLENAKAAVRNKKFRGTPSWWVRANKLKPLEEEDTLDVGHSYDGIRELDNVTPPWFTIAFIASIIFGLGYLWRYHVAHAAPLQIEEYSIAVTKANLAKEAYLKLKGDAVNENNVKMLDAAGIDAGKALYTSNCVACHGNAGQGGVGPNLTDDYWLHGGHIGDIFKTIKVGVVEKGMMSWKDVFSSEQIAELASYIKSIHGTNPAGAKEPQGEVYKDTPKAADSTSAPVKVDSTATAKL